MEEIVWFGVTPKNNIMSLNSIDGISIVHFLRGRKYRILELLILDSKTNKEKSLLWENEERLWVEKNNSTELSWLIEEDGYHSIFWAEIELENNGFIRFMHGQLIVKMSDFENLKKITIKVLDYYGYFAAAKIWEFACVCNQTIMISFVLAMEAHEITNEFARMLDYNKEIEKEQRLFDSKFNKDY